MTQSPHERNPQTGLPLAVTASPGAYLSGAASEWRQALEGLGIAMRWTIPSEHRQAHRHAGDLPVEPDAVIRDAVGYARTWRETIHPRTSAGLLVINHRAGFINHETKQPTKIENHIGVESDRSLQRALVLGMTAVLSDGFPVGHPSPLMAREVLEDQEVVAFDPNMSIAMRAALLPSFVDGLVVQTSAEGFE